MNQATYSVLTTIVKSPREGKLFADDIQRRDLLFSIYTLIPTLETNYPNVIRDAQRLNFVSNSLNMPELLDFSYCLAFVIGSMLNEVFVAQ